MCNEIECISKINDFACHQVLVKRYYMFLHDDTSCNITNAFRQDVIKPLSIYSFYSTFDIVHIWAEQET